MTADVPSYVINPVPSIESPIYCGNLKNRLDKKERAATIMSAAASNGDMSKMRSLMNEGFSPTQEDWEVLRVGAIKNNNLHNYCMSCMHLGVPRDKEQVKIMLSRAVSECDIEMIIYAQNTLQVKLGVADLNKLVYGYAFKIFKEKLFDGYLPTDLELLLTFRKRYSIGFQSEYKKTGSNEHIRLLGGSSIQRLKVLFNVANDTFGRNMCILLEEGIIELNNLLDGNVA